MHKGHYFGTEIEEIWWKRYIRGGMFARGIGEYWYDENSFNFRRYLTRKPITLRYQQMLELKTGRWHGGKWGGGFPIIKIIWKKNDVRLSSGFLLATDRERSDKILQELQDYIDRARQAGD